MVNFLVVKEANILTYDTSSSLIKSAGRKYGSNIVQLDKWLLTLWQSLYQGKNSFNFETLFLEQKKGQQLWRIQKRILWNTKAIWFTGTCSSWFAYLLRGDSSVTCFHRGRTIYSIRGSIYVFRIVVYPLGSLKIVILQADIPKKEFVKACFACSITNFESGNQRNRSCEWEDIYRINFDVRSFELLILCIICEKKDVRTLKQHFSNSTHVCSQYLNIAAAVEYWIIRTIEDSNWWSSRLDFCFEQNYNFFCFSVYTQNKG